MTLSLRRFVAIAGVLALFSTAPATHAAKAGKTASNDKTLRGTVVSFKDNVLVMKTRAGKSYDVNVAKDTGIRGVKLGDPADIKSGSFIGSAAVPQPDGTLKALQVHVFPPELRGQGEGQRPWDLTPTSTMTNGTVGNVEVSNGRTVTINYGKTRKTLVVPPDVPVVSLRVGDLSLLKPGVHVVLFATAAADGALTAKYISAGEDGVVPPM